MEPTRSRLSLLRNACYDLIFERYRARYKNNTKIYESIVLERVLGFRDINRNYCGKRNTRRRQNDYDYTFRKMTNRSE